MLTLDPDDLPPQGGAHVPPRVPVGDALASADQAAMLRRMMKQATHPALEVPLDAGLPPVERMPAPPMTDAERKSRMRNPWHGGGGFTTKG